MTASPDVLSPSIILPPLSHGSFIAGRKTIWRWFHKCYCFYPFKRSVGLKLRKPGSACNSFIRVLGVHSVGGLGGWKRSQFTRYQPGSFGQLPFTSLCLACTKRVLERAVGTRSICVTFPTLLGSLERFGIRRMDLVLCVPTSL